MFPHERLTRTQMHLVRTTVCLAVFVGAMAVIVGWVFGIGRLQTILPGLTTMKINTAVCFALAAAALLVRAEGPAAAAGVLIALVGSATLLEYFVGIRLGIDELFVSDPASTSMPYPGRMSPGSAIAFVAIGCALPLLSCKTSRPTLMTAHCLALVPATIGYLSLVGYVYGVENAYNFGPYVSLALHSAIGFCLLPVAMLLTRDEEGWTRPFRDRPIATGVMVDLIGLSIVLPFATGLVILSGERIGLYRPQFAPALFATLSSGAFLWVTVRAALTVRKAEGAMLEARDDARLKASALKASDELYGIVVDELSHLIWKTRIDGHLTFVSRRWREYTGRSASVEGGWGWSDAVHPEDRDRVLVHWRGALAGLHPYEIEYRLRRHDGVYRWFKAIGARTSETESGHWLGSLTDVQDIVEAREILKRSSADLERLVETRSAELMAAEEQLRQAHKMEAVGQLTGGIAHDFNNILTGIMGSLELLQLRMAKGRTDDIDRYIMTARAGAERAAALTHRLLAFSRRQTLDPKPTDVARLVANMENLVRSTVGPQVDVVCVHGGSLWTPLCDPPQLENALLNLCINARDAMPDGGRLTIETENAQIDDRAAHEMALDPGQYVALSVSDTGTGMTADVAARAFDPFFTTKPLGMGTGLGLSMIYGFARQSGGHVRIHSEEGSGTTVKVYLPRDYACEETASRSTHLTDVGRAEIGQTVLVVDDEPSIRMLVTEVLEDLGYATIEAGDGATGLQSVQSDARIDLLITDVGLPGGLNGRQVADAARAIRPELKVLFITGYAENGVVGKGRLDPGMWILTKPFAVEALAGLLGEMLST